MGAVKDKNGAKAAAKLRSQAEERLNKNSPKSGISSPDTETQRLLHELQVHQIELEMQNSELRQTREELEMALEKYTDLYDFAPVGYFSLNRKGEISTANLSGARILGIERAMLLGRRFGLFVTEESRSLFAEFLDKVFAHQGKESCEVTLKTEGNLPLIVQLEAIVFGPGQECHVALIDITERKLAEERITHLASFPQLNPNPVLEVDLSGRVTFFNPAAVKVMETAGMNAGEVGVFLPTDIAAIVEHWDRLHEATHYREIVINELTFAVTIFLNSQFKTVRIYAEDITERRRAEESLRHSEALYRAIGESIDYGVWICAPDGRNIYASDSFLHLVGITREQCANFGWGEVLHPDDAEQTIAAWKECVLKGETWDREHRYRGVDGQWHPILARGVPVRDDQGAITCWAGINLDISNMKKAEMKLRDSEERLRLALSAAQLATWDWNLQSGTLIWNDEHYRMLGYEPGAVVPNYHAWVDRMHPDDIVSTEAKIRECMAAGSVYTAEFRALCPDGTVRWLEARGEFTHDDAGQPLRNYGVMMDRTSQKQAETALQEAYNELTAANIELEAFNYSVSHDLRIPLTGINGYCQMVQELCGSTLDERCGGYLQEMFASTLRMSRLIDALLDFSRITRSEMRHDKVNLSKMAEEVALVLQMSAPERRVEFRIADGITVDGDAVLLQSVLDNLIGNAWKYSGNRESVVIEFGTTEIKGKSACYVKDSGPGFAREHLDKLFIPFQRLPGTKVKGHGIGLATVDRIIRRHGGRVWAEVEPGKGACFYFTLAAD